MTCWPRHQLGASNTKRLPPLPEDEREYENENENESSRPSPHRPPSPHDACFDARFLRLQKPRRKPVAPPPLRIETALSVSDCSSPSGRGAPTTPSPLSMRFSWLSPPPPPMALLDMARPDSATLPPCSPPAPFAPAHPPRSATLDPRRFHAVQRLAPPRTQYWLAVDDVLAGVPGREHLPPRQWDGAADLARAVRLDTRDRCYAWVQLVTGWCDDGGAGPAPQTEPRA